MVYAGGGYLVEARLQQVVAVDVHDKKRHEKAALDTFIERLLLRHLLQNRAFPQEETFLRFRGEQERELRQEKSRVVGQRLWALLPRHDVFFPLVVVFDEHRVGEAAEGGVVEQRRRHEGVVPFPVDLVQPVQGDAEGRDGVGIEPVDVHGVREVLLQRLAAKCVRALCAVRRRDSWHAVY